MSKSKTLGVNVVVADEVGEPHTFLAGSKPPAWAAEKLGDHCWEGYETPSRGGHNEQPLGAAEVSGGQGAVVPPEGSGSGDGSGDGSGGGEAPVPPPMGGAGSGAEAWAEYAKGLGLEPAEGASRDDVVALVKAGGFPTEKPAE